MQKLQTSEGGKDTVKWEKYHYKKKSWKAFSDKLVTLTFESLASVSTEVVVALRGVARIYIVTPRVF